MQLQTEYPFRELCRQLSFISYHFHWSPKNGLTIPHLERERFCREIRQSNRQSNGEEKNIFEL